MTPTTDNYSTLSGAEIGERFHHLAEHDLSIEGAAEAFRSLHGYGPDYDTVRDFPAFAFDSKAGIWREWNHGEGWKPRRNVLPEMTTIMGALCSLAAYKNTDSGDKAEKEYRKLRQRHLGSDVDRAIRLASALTAVEDWDTDPTLMGTPGGNAMYVTPTNHARPVHDFDQEPTDHITRSMGAGPDTPTDLWTGLIDGMTGGDVAMAEALQTWTAGALLEGNPQRKAHILYGDGRTGKSTYLKTVQTAMGDYAGSARASVFVSERDNHPAELLPFIDKRLVVLPELPLGALRSDLLKTVTGGDAISVRGMHQNPRTETPSATLMFSCNELPSIRMVDNAIRDRLMVWPFDHKPASVDVRLGEKLASQKHLPGVVGWLKAGLVRYARIFDAGGDMPMPEAVKAATSEYLAEADTIGQWRDACTGEGGETQATVLYRSYFNWCEGRKRRPLSERSFTLWLRRNYERRHTREGSSYPVTVVA